MGTDADLASCASLARRDNFWQIAQSLAILFVTLFGGVVSVGFPSGKDYRGQTPVSPKT
jgi:hypothetical protein